MAGVLDPDLDLAEERQAVSQATNGLNVGDADARGTR